VAQPVLKYLLMAVIEGIKLDSSEEINMTYVALRIPAHNTRRDMCFCSKRASRFSTAEVQIIFFLPEVQLSFREWVWVQLHLFPFTDEAGFATVSALADKTV
jgi:hypothetical protein